MPNINILIENKINEVLCKKCNRVLPISEFRKSGKWINYCKDCQRNKLNKWRKENPEKFKIQQDRNHAKNKGKYREANKLWKKKNNEHLKRYSREYYKRSDKSKRNKNFYTRLKTDTLFRIKNQMRTDLNKRLKKMFGSSSNKPSKMLGCSLPDMKIYLENKFQYGMSWENYGGKRYNQDGTKRVCWEIDHIVPMESAKTKEDMYKLCHYTNLQPLWWWDNSAKGKHIK